MRAEDTLRALAAAVGRARELGCSVSVDVVDEQGRSVGRVSMEGAPPTSVAVAGKKAFSACNFGTSTQEVAALLTPQSRQIAATGADPRLTFEAGGFVLLREGRLVGAVGVAGGTVEQDVACGQAAKRAVSGEGFSP